MVNHTNLDGLQVTFGAEPLARVGTDQSATFRMTVDLDATDLPTYTADLNNDGTNDGFSGRDASIPAGAYITGAYLVVTEAFAGGTSINLGFHEQDGTAIDVDGIDAGVTVAALAANRAVNCDGALVGGTVTVGADDAYFRAAPTGTFTAGKGTLYIEYVKP